jgi:hypothetical protein
VPFFKKFFDCGSESKAFVVYVFVYMVQLVAFSIRVLCKEMTQNTKSIQYSHPGNRAFSTLKDATSLKTLVIQLTKP